MKDKLGWKTKWTIRKYESQEAYENGDEPFEVSEVKGNVALNEGLTLVAQLIGGTASPTQWDNANANLGVGNSSTASAATQTGLQGASTAFSGMESGYPSVSSQTITWRAVFGGSEANFAWEEFTVVNAASDTGENLNRLVSSQGTKSSGQTWTLDLDITLS